MLLVSLSLTLGVLFQMMIWPFADSMVIIGSITLLMSSIVILIYSIAQKVKIPQAMLFSVIGFCSLAYCFKILFWPGCKFKL